MARKGIKKQFWMSRDQADLLSRKASMACLTESALIRMLINGYHPPAAPDGRFYDDLNRLINAAERIEFNAEQTSELKMRESFYETADEIMSLCSEIRRRYLRGEREKIQWL